MMLLAKKLLAGLAAPSVFDVLTASYASKSFSVTTQDATPNGLAFSADGTSMYAAGNTNNTIYQYALSTAWDVSTASYASKSYSVATETSTPVGLAFSADGTKMYVSANSAGVIYQYTLSTAWDVSTASYASKSLNVSAKEAGPFGLFLKSDGTKLYVSGVSSDSLHAYTLSTAWDVSTGSFSSTLSLTSYGSEIRGNCLSSDGLNLYVACSLGTYNDTILQFTLSSAWDISTASFYGSLSVATQGASPGGLGISSDDLKVFTLDAGNDTVFQYE